MLTFAQVMNKLNAAARPDQLQGMARYGINPRNRLGVSMPELRALAKGIGRDHRLALRPGCADWTPGMSAIRFA